MVSLTMDNQELAVASTFKWILRKVTIKISFSLCLLKMIKLSSFEG